MLSSKRKPGVAMINSYIFPATGNMTPSTIRSKLTTMRIIS